jgi:signal transduction histidine kinase
VELGASARPDGMLHFWTRDNGPGIPPETRTHLFKPHNQINPVGSRGHGLGLSIVLHIVEKLGGEVGVESEVGQGSLFYFTLPAAASYAV